MARQITKAITRELPPLGLTCECPTCGARQRDDQTGVWVFKIDASGITFKQKRRRKRVFVLPWRDALNGALRRGVVFQNTMA